MGEVPQLQIWTGDDLSEPLFITYLVEQGMIGDYNPMISGQSKLIDWAYQIRI